MVKKIVALMSAVVFTAGFVFAQELEVSGEMKTGFFWERIMVDGEEAYEEAMMHNNDDAGNNQGRFRLNFHLLNSESNIGMKVRFEQTSWTASQPNFWAYAFAYGNFIDDQLRVTIGKLGESPWGVGGPDLWNELDNLVGIRTEILPRFVPGLDVGFVLNNYNNTPHNQEADVNFLKEMLMETVFGIAYTNDYLHARWAYRLDGKRDNVSYSTFTGEIIEDRMEMVYRLEERFLRTVVDGLSIWANGYWKGLGESSKVDFLDSVFSLQNYLYLDYSPSAFSSQLRFGLTVNRGLQTFIGRASFYYNIFPILSAGTAFNFRQEFGENSVRDNPFVLWGIEPQVRVTFNSNAYIAFVYNYGQQYVTQGQAEPVLQERHWINLRVVYTF